MAMMNAAEHSSELIQEMTEIINGFEKRLDLIFTQLEESVMKKIGHVAALVAEVELADEGFESDLTGAAVDEPDLVDDEEVEASLFNSDEIEPKLLGDGEIQPSMVSTNGLKVELTSSVLVEEDYSEALVPRAARNNQLCVIMKSGLTINLEIYDQIGMILTEQEAATVMSSTSAKKKKKEKKESRFVKDRGKMQGQCISSIARRPKNDLAPSKSKLPASAWKRKRMKEITWVSGRGKSGVTEEGRGDRNYMKSPRKQIGEAWSRRIATRGQRRSSENALGSSHVLDKLLRERNETMAARSSDESRRAGRGNRWSFVSYVIVRSHPAQYCGPHRQIENGVVRASPPKPLNPSRRRRGSTLEELQFYKHEKDELWVAVRGSERSFNTTEARNELSKRWKRDKPKTATWHVGAETPTGQDGGYEEAWSHQADMGSWSWNGQQRRQPQRQVRGRGEAKTRRRGAKARKSGGGMTQGNGCEEAWSRRVAVRRQQQVFWKD